MKNFILNRLKETSTWQALTVMLTLFGVSLSPEQKVAIIEAGVAVVAALGLFLPDKIKE